MVIFAPHWCRPRVLFCVESTRPGGGSTPLHSQHILKKWDFENPKMKTIKEFPNYSITPDGQVYSHLTNKYLTPFVTAVFIKKLNKYLGYPKVQLRHDGVKKRRFIHRLVAEAYIPNPNNYPQVNHIDGDKLNFSIENLEWVTSKMNVQHAYDTGLMNLERPKGKEHGLYRPEAHIKQPRKKGDLHKSTKIPDSVIKQIPVLFKLYKGRPCRNQLIASELGIRQQLVSQVLTGRNRAKGMFDKEIIRLHREGLKDWEISDTLGCSIKLVQRITT